jgi:hypothetical protein
MKTLFVSNFYISRGAKALSSGTAKAAAKYRKLLNAGHPIMTDHAPSTIIWQRPLLAQSSLGRLRPEADIPNFRRIL